MANPRCRWCGRDPGPQANDVGVAHGEAGHHPSEGDAPIFRRFSEYRRFAAPRFLLATRCASRLRASRLRIFIRPVSSCGTPLASETRLRSCSGCWRRWVELRSAAPTLGRFTACRRASSGERQGHSMIQASFRLVAPEGKRQEFRDVLLHVKGPTEALPECRACWICQDIEDDHVFTYFVQWDTQEELESHLRSERFRRLLPYIEMSVEASGSQLWQHRAYPWDRVPGWRCSVRNT